MSASALLWTLGGLGLLALVLYDVFATVLHHWGGRGPLSGRVVHHLWRLVVYLTGGIEPTRRRRILGGLGPLLIPVTVLLWAGLLILGFAFLYLPWIAASFAPDSGVPPPRQFGDALHFSGVSFFTIGYGDIVPLTSGMRALGVIEGGAGFALITLVISYFVSVYSAYSSQKVLAESLYFQAERSADASRLMAQHLAGGSAATLANEVARLRDRLAAIRTDYMNYPLLHYFTASRTEASLARVLFVTQDLGLLLDTVIDQRQSPVAAGLGRRSGLRFAASSVQDGIADTLLRHASRGGDEPTPADRESWRARFERARELLRDYGVPIREDEDAVRDYCEGRDQWEPLLRACTRKLGEEWEDVTGQS